MLVLVSYPSLMVTSQIPKCLGIPLLWDIKRWTAFKFWAFCKAFSVPLQVSTLETKVNRGPFIAAGTPAKCAIHTLNTHRGRLA